MARIRVHKKWNLSFTIELKTLKEIIHTTLHFSEFLRRKLSNSYFLFPASSPSSV